MSTWDDMAGQQALAAQQAQDIHNAMGSVGSYGWAQAQQWAAAQEQQNQLLPKQQFSRRGERARELFTRRMGGVNGEFKLAHDDFLHVQCYENDVFVFFLFDGREGVMKESADIFPSDTLIAQFRMLVIA